MHFQHTILLLLPALSLAAPAGQAIRASSSRSSAPKSTSTPDNNAAAANGTAVSDTQLLNAVNGWQNDTGKVTRFLNTATSFTGDEYTRQATIALNAEVDELNHKAILDAGLGDQAAVQAANDTLATQGTFQAVVDALQAMVNEGPETAQQRVNEINNNRCVNVLPNINAYFAAAGAPESSAVVPTGCLEVAATNPGSVLPSGIPAPAGNNSSPGNQVTSAPSSSSTSAAGGDAAASSSSSSSSTTTRANAGNGNDNARNGTATTTTAANAGGDAAATISSSSSVSTTTRAANRGGNGNAGAGNGNAGNGNAGPGNGNAGGNANDNAGNGNGNARATTTARARTTARATTTAAAARGNGNSNAKRAMHIL